MIVAGNELNAPEEDAFADFNIYNGDELDEGEKKPLKTIHGQRSNFELLNSSKPSEPVLALPVVKPDTSDKSTFVNMMHKKLWLEFRNRVSNMRNAAAVLGRQLDRQMD